MDHTEIIDGLGGIPVVAAALGKHRSRVGDWRRNGIPPSSWADIVGLAKARGVAGVSFEALANGKPTTVVPYLPRGRRPRQTEAA